MDIFFVSVCGVGSKWTEITEKSGDGNCIALTEPQFDDSTKLKLVCARF